MNFYPINLFLYDAETDEAVRKAGCNIVRESEKVIEIYLNKDRCKNVLGERIVYPPISESVEFVETHNNTISITKPD